MQSHQYRVSFGLILSFLLALTGCAGLTRSGSTSGSSSNNSGSASSGGSGSTGTPGGGSSSTGTAAPAEYLYALENPNAASVVEAFSISSTGALTVLSPTVPAGTNGSDIAADPNGKFVVAGNSPCCADPSNPAIQLTSYSIGTSGALTQADQQAVPNALNDQLNGLLLDPSGTDLYASQQQVQIEGTISSYSVNSGSGHLTLLQPDPTNTIMPGRMSIHPNGKYLYAAILARHHYPELGGFALFQRDPATGKITYNGQEYHSSAPSSDFYGDSAIVLGGQYLLGVSPDSHKITAWSINAATGDLTLGPELSGNFQGLTTDRSGNFAIVTSTDGTVSSYRVNADGSLTQAGTASAATGVTNVVTDPSGKFAYAESSTVAQIYGFSFDPATGSLTSLPGSPFATSGVPVRMAVTATK